MNIFITGGAGFIGFNLTKRLILEGNSVTILDNFFIGRKEFFSHIRSKRLRIIKGDVLDMPLLVRTMKDNNIVYHLSANSDVQKGMLKQNLDLEQNVIATLNVLEAMKINKIKKLVFPSSMTIYGNVVKKNVYENYGPCLPISMYGATKLACESMIAAFSASYDIQAWIYRFANVIGSPATHGVIFDLINKLLINNQQLGVLGDGNQRKPYIFIDDAIDCLLFCFKNSKNRINIFNVGVSDTINVREIVEIILKKMKLKDTEVTYAETPYGWKGDVPEFKLNITKIKKLGFKPQFSSRQAIKLAVNSILLQQRYTVK